MQYVKVQKIISSPGENDKRESSQKVGLKKWNLKALEKERTKGQPSRTPRMGKSTRGFLKKEPQKKKIMRNEERTNH